MNIGSTPTHAFEIPEDVSVDDLDGIQITYSQNKNVILQYTKDDVETVSEGNLITVTLSQEDTFKFPKDGRVDIQVRLLIDDKVLASTIISTLAQRCLDTNILREPE